MKKPEKKNIHFKAYDLADNIEKWNNIGHNFACEEWEKYHEHIMKANNTCPTALLDKDYNQCQARQVINDLTEALNAMIVATNFDVALPEGHPGHEAYLNTVAIPRAKQAIAKAEGHE